MVKVLFVCLGNICRSPMAEAVFRHQLQGAGLEHQIITDSAGTASWHTGNPPHKGTREKLKEHGISFEGMKARPLTEADFTEFNYIIVMDDDNLTSIQSTFSVNDESASVYKLMDFVAEPKEMNVPDPYYTGDFDYTYELIQEACSSLLAFLLEKEI